MRKLSMPCWIRHAAAARCGRSGAVTARAEAAACRRQTVYDHGRRLVERVAERDQKCDPLRAEAAQLPAERDALPQRLQDAVVVGPEEVERFVGVSRATGISLRQAEALLGTLLPAARVPDQATLGRWTEAAGRRAGAVLAVRAPPRAPAVPTLGVDEIFWGVATLVAVEPASLARLACDKTGDRCGAVWPAVLEPFAHRAFVVSEAASGIAAGVAAVAKARSASAVPLAHGLDVFPTNQEARRGRAGPWRRAEAAWDEAGAADAPVAEAKRHGKDARGVAQQARRAWDQAERLLADVDRQEAAWPRARAAWAVFRPDGTLNERAWAAAELAAALGELRSPEGKKVGHFLKDPRALAFVERLQRRLAEAEPEAAWRPAWVRRWWLRHRAAPPALPPPTAVEPVQALLDAKVRDGERTAAEQAAYDRGAAVLRTTVRASRAVEGINSVLRRQQGRHRKMTHGLLDRKRLYGNCRRLQPGKRRGRCPYEMLGVPRPNTDCWALLPSVPQPTGRQLPEKVSGSGDGA
jgi:hypothetical protein